MTPELSRRLGRALGEHPVTLEERREIVRVAEQVETFDELPNAVQSLVIEIEGRSYQDEPLVAAGGHTGTMIALVPTEADAQRLAVDDGEDADELHITLAYLGEAAMIPVEIRRALVDCVSKCVQDKPTVIGNAFSVNLFNPEDKTITAGGKEPCVVLGVGGEQLTKLRADVVWNVRNVYDHFGLDMPVQHQPWVAHMTLVYTGDADLTYFTDRMGPITFDAVRLAFGDDVYDIPLGDNTDETITADAFKFDPTQPRDKRGRWAKKSGGGAAVSGHTEAGPKVRQHSDVVDEVKSGKYSDGDIIGYARDPFGSGVTRVVSRGGDEVDIEVRAGGEWTSVGIGGPVSTLGNILSEVHDEPPKPRTSSIPPPETAPEGIQTERWALKAAPKPNNAALDEAVGVYTSDDYRDINEVYRGTLSDPNVRIKSAVSELNDGFSTHQLKDDVEVFRGVFSGSRVFGKDAWNQPSLVGMEWTDRAPASTTAKPSVADDFTSKYTGESALLKIRAPRGTPAIRASEWGYEAEILLGPELRYRVVEDNGVVDNVRQLTIEVII